MAYTYNRYKATGYIPTKAEERIGQTRTATCGMRMEIIEYRDYHDIDVRFEDGNIVRHKGYKEFCIGHIGHPIYKMTARKNQNYVYTPFYDAYNNTHIGETSIATNGMRMMIIAYWTCKQISIQFEDGAIKDNVRYDKFKQGIVSYNGAKKADNSTNSSENNAISYKELHRLLSFNDEEIRQEIEYHTMRVNLLKGLLNKNIKEVK